jgi:hypothetical protein
VGLLLLVRASRSGAKRRNLFARPAPATAVRPPPWPPLRSAACGLAPSLEASVAVGCLVHRGDWWDLALPFTSLTGKRIQVGVLWRRRPRATGTATARRGCRPSRCFRWSSRPAGRLLLLLACPLSTPPRSSGRRHRGALRSSPSSRLGSLVSKIVSLCAGWELRTVQEGLLPPRVRSIRTRCRRRRLVSALSLSSLWCFQIVRGELVWVMDAPYSVELFSWGDQGMDWIK